MVAILTPNGQPALGGWLILVGVAVILILGFAIRKTYSYRKTRRTLRRSQNAIEGGDQDAQQTELQPARWRLPGKKYHKTDNEAGVKVIEMGNRTEAENHNRHS
jgi:Sec-independent protein translocase protein TatA